MTHDEEKTVADVVVIFCAEIDRLKRENETLKIDASNHAADAETVRRERETERRRAEAAEAEAKRLRDALAPFARESKVWAPMYEDNFVPNLTPSVSESSDRELANFTIGDLRLAAALSTQAQGASGAKNAPESTGGEHDAGK